MINQQKGQERNYSYIKQNSAKNSFKTFIAALLGASIMPVVEYFFFQTSFDISQQLLMALIIAIGITLGFVVFRSIFK
jgi:VIT1/CCC1 family predicted Fe2+/Mn2+ transporter